MMKQLRANSQRVERSAARAASASRPATSQALSTVFAAYATTAAMPAAGMFGLGTDVTTRVWNVKPSVHQPAICTFGKYHTRRLQEMRT